MRGSSFSGSCLSALALAIAACLSGCGSDDGLNRQAVSGKATSDGAPIPAGAISFEPLQAGGVGSGAVITNGEYSIAAETGLPPGKYRVTMQGDDGTPFTSSEGKMPGDEEMPPRKQLVPPNWQQEVEVREGDNLLDFAVTMPRNK